MNNTKILNYFLKVDKKLYQTATNIQFSQILTLQNSNTYLESLSEIIISQQLSIKASDTIMKRFKILFPESKISANILLNLEENKIRSTGISYPKIKYLKDLAAKIEAKEIDLSKLPSLSDSEIKEKLLKIKGIGEWSTEMFLIFSLGREDIFSQKDLGLKQAIKKIYNIETPTKDEIMKISHKWAPYRSYASLILWKSLNNK